MCLNICRTSNESKNNLLVKDPIANFRITKEEIIPQFLTKKEIQVLSDKIFIK